MHLSNIARSAPAGLTTGKGAKILGTITIGDDVAIGGHHLDLGLEGIECLLQVRNHVLARLRPLDEDDQVVDPTAERVLEVHVLAHPLPPAERRLGFGLVVPEIRRGDMRLEPAQFLVKSSGVKDSSGDRRPA